MLAPTFPVSLPGARFIGTLLLSTSAGAAANIVRVARWATHMQQWVFEHAIDCGVSIQFAWNFWTNVSNWVLDPDVDSIEIQGEFAAGTNGVTHSRSSGKINWRITEVVQPCKAVIEFPAPGAVARFLWTFEDVDGRTRISQQVSLSGEQVAMYVDKFSTGLRAGIPAGMLKLCEAMQAAARTSAK